MAIAFDASLGTVTNSGTLTTSAAAASGSRIFACVGWFSSTQTLTGGTTSGLTWVVDHQFRAFGDANVGIMSADAASGLASSSTIVPTFSGSVTLRGLGAFSFTGLATGSSGYVDATATGSTSTSAGDWTTNNLATTMADTLLVGVSVADCVAGQSENVNYTEALDFIWFSGQALGAAYRIVSSAATYNPTAQWDGSLSYQLNLGIAYEQAAAGPTTYEETGALTAGTSPAGADVAEYVEAGALIGGTNLAGAKEHVAAAPTIRVIQSGVRFR